MNLIKLLALIAGNQVKDAAEWVKDNIGLSLRLLYLSVGVPLALAFVGFIAAGVSDNETAIGFGRALIYVAGLMSSGLLLLFWIRATTLVNIIVYATKGASLVLKKIKPLDVNEAEKFVRWLRGVTTWLTAVWLYVMVFPIWRDLGVTAIVLTCLVFFSGVMSSHWFESPATRYVVSAVVVGIFLFGTLWSVSPKFVEAVKGLATSVVGDISQWGERREKLNAVKQAAEQTEASLDQDLLRRLAAKQNQIRRRAIENCGGRFCSEADSLEFQKIEEDIVRIQDGTFWQEKAKEAKRPAPAVLQPAVSSGSSDAVELPPPSPRKKAASRRLKNSAFQDVFRELDKYPDL